MHKLDDVIKHVGVKGMKWGVRRDDRSSTGGKSDSSPKKKGTIKSHLDSAKRERDWNKVVKNMDSLTTKDINKVSRRIQLENDLKKMSKSKVANEKDKADYLRRDKMSDHELNRKVQRLRAKETLTTKASEASKSQRELGQKIVQIGGSLGLQYSLGKTIAPVDVLEAYTKPKETYSKAKNDVLQEALRKVRR